MSDTKTETKKPDVKAALPPQRTESRQSIQSPPNAVSANSEPASEEVAALAYQLWVERGSPHGSHEEDWLKAEEQLRNAPLTSKASA